MGLFTQKCNRMFKTIDGQKRRASEEESVKKEITIEIRVEENELKNGIRAKCSRSSESYMRSGF